MPVKKIFIFSTIVIAVFFTIGYTANENFGQVTLKTHYDTFIDELISRCEYKEAAMFDSKLNNIRRAASLACLKAAYLKTHKEILIGKLMAEEVGIKTHKIQYYLNKEFFAVLRTATSPGKY